MKVRRFPEITFPLKQIKKKDSEKYEELVEIISNMKNQKDKEIKELKEKVNYLENLLQIKNENVKKSSSSFEGSTLEIFNIGKDEYFNYFPEKNQYKKDINFFGYTVILECDEKNVKEVIEKPKEEKKLSKREVNNLFDKLYKERIVLKENETPSEVPEEKEEKEEENEILTETLAGIYIKQGKFENAIKIIRQLSLKYPKKNRYFADQIRFLEKLIINNKNK